MKNLKYFWDILKKLNKLLDSRQKLQGMKIIIWMLIASVFELLGISVIYPFLNVLLNPEETVSNKYVAQFMDWTGIQSHVGITLVFVIAIIGIYSIKNLFLIYSRGIQAKYEYQIEQDMAVFMVRSYMNRTYSYFTHANSSDILHSIVTDLKYVSEILKNVFCLLAESVTIIFIVAYLIATDWFMAVGVTFAAGLIVVLLTLIFKNILARTGEKYRIRELERDKSVLQLSQGIKDIFVMHRKQYFIDDFENTSNEYKKLRIIYDVINGCPERINEAALIAVILLIVALRISYGVDVAAFVPQLGIFVVAAYRLLPAMNKFSSNFSHLVFYKDSLEAVYENIQIARKFEQMQKARDDRDISLTFENSIEVQHVTWWYDQSEKNVLEDVSLKICKGDSIAIIGESGAGKTTLADILLGLYEPKQGKVLVDGVDVYAHLEQWAGIISYVPQTIYLLDDTIRANIVFGYSETDDEKIWEALEQAQLKTFVEGLPHGLDTLVGERGVRFSGGQRQRIAIARALYSNPSVLLLDEATSALDNDTETAVMEAVESLKGKKTLIIIAHRLSTLKKCNKLYEVKNGKTIFHDDINNFLGEGIST